mgnify:CR=1 FL=1
MKFFEFAVELVFEVRAKAVAGLKKRVKVEDVLIGSNRYFTK